MYYYSKHVIYELCKHIFERAGRVAYINLSAGNNRWWPEKWFSPTSTTTFLFGSAATVNRKFFKTTACNSRPRAVRDGGIGKAFRTITTETRVKSSRFKSHKGDRRERPERKRFVMTCARKRPGFRETDGTRASLRLRGFFYRGRLFFFFYIVPWPLFNSFTVVNDPIIRLSQILRITPPHDNLSGVNTSENTL